MLLLLKLPVTGLRKRGCQKCYRVGEIFIGVRRKGSPVKLNWYLRVRSRRKVVVRWFVVAKQKLIVFYGLQFRTFEVVCYNRKIITSAFAKSGLYCIQRVFTRDISTPKPCSNKNSASLTFKIKSLDVLFAPC
jgi:hypothetical protein